jgi:hypothetical protein
LHLFILAAGVPEPFAAATVQTLLDQHVDSATRLGKLAALRDLAEILPDITAQDLKEHLALFGLLTRGASSASVRVDASEGPGGEVAGKDCAAQTDAPTSREFTLASAPGLTQGEEPAPEERPPSLVSAPASSPPPASMSAKASHHFKEAMAVGREKAGQAGAWLSEQGSRAAESLRHFASRAKESGQHCVSHPAFARVGDRCAKAAH